MNPGYGELYMRIQDLNGKSVCILGFGKEGQATLKALEKYAPDAKVTIADDKGQGTSDVGHGTWIGTIRDAVGRADNFDFYIKSPGISPEAVVTCPMSHVTSSTQLFLDSIADSGATVIGVTGSKGKSTTTTLMYEILSKAGKDAHLIGNIGIPAISFIEHAKPGVTFVMEMSSYQLMDLTVSPHIAVITSFFPEHLDYHGSLAAYKEAKKHITRFQTKDDIVFYASSHPNPLPLKGERAERAEASSGEGVFEIAQESVGKKIAVSAAESPIAIEDTKLIGKHNLSNIALACAVAQHLGIPESTYIDVCRNFQGLPHRLQSLGVHHGIEWIDDAISTTPDSTIAALDALGDRVKTIILGGTDRGLDFAELGKRIAKSGIETVILFPGSGPRIRKAIEDAGTTVRFIEADSMSKAVSASKQWTPKGMIVLLSTASPSYNMFKNF